MKADPLQILKTLFSRVLVCDERGSVVHAIGGPAAPSIFEEPNLDLVRDSLREALGGVPFQATIPQIGGGTLRVRAVPLHGSSGTLAVALEPQNQSLESLVEHEFAYLVQHLRQGLWRLDPEGRIVEANSHLAEWLGVHLDALIGTHASRWRIKCPAGDRYESEFRTKSGETRRGMVIRSEIHSLAGSRQGAIEIVTDVSAEHAFRAKLVDEVRRMSRLARTDALTGLPNRLVFEERLEELQSGERPFALLLVDLDDLKVINDTQGHAHGDRALVDIANRLREVLRTTDLVARIGGDEFAVLLPDTDMAASTMLLERLRTKLAQGSSPYSPRASVGLSHSDAGEENMRKAADEAMYRDKRARKTEE